MVIQLRVLVLTFVATLAMGTVAATGAQAANADFTAEEYPAVAKGEQEGTTNYFEGTENEKVECETTTYQAKFNSAQATLTVTPHYAGCKRINAEFEVDVTITLHGCHYLFHTSGTTVAGSTPGTADIVCPEEKEITIEGAFGVCRDSIEPQTGLTGVTFLNRAATEETPKPWVTVEVDIEDQIAYTHEDTPFCPWGPTENPETREDGSFVSNVELKGYENTGLTTTGPTGENTTYETESEIGIHVE